VAPGRASDTASTPRCLSGPGLQSPCDAYADAPVACGSNAVGANGLLAWVARRVHPLQIWWSAWNARVAERDVAPTAQALQRLGLADLPILSLRETGQKTAGSVKLRYQLLTFAVWMGAGDLLIAVIKTIDTRRVQPDLRPEPLMLAAVTLPLLMWAAQRGKATVGYRFLLSIMAAIEACEAVVSASTSDRHQALRHLDIRAPTFGGRFCGSTGSRTASDADLLGSAARSATQHSWWPNCSSLRRRLMPTTFNPLVVGSSPTGPTVRRRAPCPLTCCPDAVSFPDPCRRPASAPRMPSRRPCRPRPSTGLSPR
jgi:hypothetical protein